MVHIQNFTRMLTRRPLLLLLEAYNQATIWWPTAFHYFIGKSCQTPTWERGLSVAMRRQAQKKWRVYKPLLQGCQSCIVHWIGYFQFIVIDHAEDGCWLQRMDTVSCYGQTLCKLNSGECYRQKEACSDDCIKFGGITHEYWSSCKHVHECYKLCNNKSIMKRRIIIWFWIKIMQQWF